MVVLSLWGQEGADGRVVVTSGISCLYLCMEHCKAPNMETVSMQPSLPLALWFPMRFCCIRACWERDTSSRKKRGHFNHLPTQAWPLWKGLPKEVTVESFQPGEQQKSKSCSVKMMGSEA